MDSRRLRIAPETRRELNDSEPNKCIRLKDLLNVLRDADGANLAWLEDFSDDMVAVNSDLYEVLAAYRQYSKAA